MFLKTVITFAVFITATFLTGCDLFHALGQAEVFSYKWLWAEPRTNPPSNEVFEVRSSTTSGCGAPVRKKAMTFVQLVDAAQTGAWPLEVANCLETSSVPVPQIRDQGLEAKFRLRVPSANSYHTDLEVTHSVFSGVSSEPTRTTINPRDALALQELSTNGAMTVFFGSDAFECQSASNLNPWRLHADAPTTDEFFAYKLTALERNNRKGSGEFQCVARNRIDPTDKRLLLITDGTFAMNVHN